MSPWENRPGCSWCLDLGYYLAHEKGLDERKAREVPRWRGSEVFTELERDVRSRFNSAMGLASQGFSDVCELPLAAAPLARSAESSNA